jgi:hypothetical protein
MHTNYYIGQNITFKTPYFESWFYFRAVIIGLRNNYVLVQYENYVNDKTYQFQTEIAISNIIN